jgi:ABC-type multidrug transport system fused ATPase/permease subunit
MILRKQSLLSLVRRLWFHIGLKRRRQSLMVLGFMVATSFAEVMSIGAVLPFLGALTAPAKVFYHPLASSFIQNLGLTEPSELALPLSLVFCVASIIAGAMRIILLRVLLRLSFGIGSDVSNDIYRRTLYQPYSVHVGRNSSEVINGISVKINEVIFFVVMPMLNLLSAAFMSITVIIALTILVPLPALLVFTFFGLLYGLLIIKLRHYLKLNSKLIAVSSTNNIRFLQEGLGGIRDILIDGTQEKFCKSFRESDANLRKAQRNNQFISYAPRFAIETAGMVLIAGVAIMLAGDEGGVSDALPMLAALALGLQRLLPALQLSYQSWATIQGAQDSLHDALSLLDQAEPQETFDKTVKISFEREINIKNLSFRYSEDSSWILREFNLIIPKGSRIGFVGATGGGKSTLLDIVMGLLQPTSGKIEVDDVELTAYNLSNWRAHISHVPQNIFLADTNISANIAFGVPSDEIDYDRVRCAATGAKISETIESFANGYNTFVGERGVQLSGGQRQRIGIARALYKQSDIIVFDEATSALDTVTEMEVMNVIDELPNHVTVLIIAHRLSTLNNCNRIVDLTPLSQ